MFDVQSVGCASQAEFHISGVAGLKSGQSNHQETVLFWPSFIQEVQGYKVAPLSLTFLAGRLARGVARWCLEWQLGCIRYDHQHLDFLMAESRVVEEDGRYHRTME